MKTGLSRRATALFLCAGEGDRCYDCQSPERICRGTLIQTQPMTGTTTEVILIKEPLGY